MAAAVEQHGYAGTTVAEIVRLARTSRRNFYEHFADRAACFLALFDTVNDQLMAQIADSVSPDAPWEEQVDVAIDAYLNSVAARPALYRSFVRELPALGDAGAARQLAVVERFAALLVGLVESGRRHRPEIEAGPLTKDMAVIIVGGLRELTVIAIQQGRDVTDLHAAAAATVKPILLAAVLHR